MYKYYQPNKKDLKDKHRDCVIRCLTKVLDADWLDIFEQLLPYTRELQCMPNGKSCYEQFLKDNGFTYHGISNRKGSKRPTVKHFTKEHKAGVYVLRVAHHVVAAVDGTYYDTWDSGDKSLCGYWAKER